MCVCVRACVCRFWPWMRVFSTQSFEFRCKNECIGRLSYKYNIFYTCLGSYSYSWCHGISLVLISDSFANVICQCCSELCFKHEHSIAYVAYATTVFFIELLLLQGSWSALRVPAFMLLERARILIFKPSVCHPEVLSPNLFFFLPGCPSVTMSAWGCKLRFVD